MIVVCPGCQARYKFDEAKLSGRAKGKTRCTKCGGTIEIDSPVGGSTLPPSVPVESAAPTVLPEDADKTDTRRSPTSSDVGDGTITGKDLHKMGVLELPKDKRFSLAVIQGEATGQIFPIAKTRTTLGRSGADINLNDPEASRQHAALEILGDNAILHDLGSTNGTYIDMDRIEHQSLTNQMEFRIGSHVLMFIVTDVE